MKCYEIKKQCSLIFLFIAIVLFFLVAIPIPTKAETMYNSSAALNYAKNHWNDGKGKCAEFVSDCLKAGGCRAWSTSASTLLGQLKNCGMGQLYELNFSSGQTIYLPNYSGKISAGDPVFYFCSGCTDGKPYVHTVICNGSDSSGYMKAYSHNNANSGTSRYSYGNTCYACNGKITKAYVYHFNTNQVPKIIVDSLQSNGDGTIKIRGWAFDPDNSSASLTIHTYIGGDVGTAGIEGWQFVANGESYDVNNAYGISGNHRFDVIIKTAKRGNQDIILYALDTKQGTNGRFGTKVNITNLNDIIIDNSLSVDEEKSKSVSFSFHGDGIHQLLYRINNDSIIKAEWESVNWKDTKGTIKINGLKEGKTYLDICFLDNNGKEFYKKTIEVNVIHVHKYIIEKITKEASCYSTGIKSFYCACGAVSSQKIIIEKTNHKYVKDEAVEATCIENGKTEGKHCELCGYVLNKQQIIQKKQHSYNNGVCIWCGLNLNESSDDVKQDDPSTNSKEEKIENKPIDKFDTEKNTLCFEKNKIEYRVLDSKKKQVIVLGCSNHKCNRIEIPATIDYNNTIYTVVSIASNAFANMNNLSVVKIGKNISSIGKKAFYNCNKLKYIYVNSNKIKHIGKNAFKKIKPNCKFYINTRKIKKYKILFVK